MSQSFAKQIFGQVVEVIRAQTPSPSSIKANPLSTFMSSSIHSEQNYSNSSFRAGKLGEQKGHKKLPDALTNYTDNSSVRISGGELKGLRKNRVIENSNGVQEKSIRQVNIKKLSKNDSFYCMCCEGEQKNQNCIACQGAGSADGTNKIVKFIEYIMQFKLGIKQSYVKPKLDHKIAVNRCQEELPINYCRTQSQNPKLLVCGDEKKLKKSINLSNKNPVPVGSLAINSNQSNRINEFCSDFIKSLPSQEPVRPSGESAVGPVDQKMKMTQSTYQSNSNLSYNNKSLVLIDDNNVSSINVGIKGMAESIIDDSLNQRPSKLVLANSRNELADQESIGEYYGYDSLSNTVKSPNSSSVLVASKKAPNICPNRLSIPQKQTLSISEMRQKLSLQNNIHCGYQCNQCYVSPIVGTRYHCTSFICDDDYDLCQECYRKYGHKHNMMEIRGRNLDKICEGFELRSSKSIRYSTRMSMGYGEGRGDLEGEDSYDNNMIFKSSIH